MKTNINILILEDNPDDLFLLQEAIESSKEIKSTILNADRLDKAIETAKKQTIDIAILDLNIPDSFGLDTFLDFHKQFPLTPIVIMTGNKDHNIAVEAVQQGAQDYLNKGEPSASAIVRTLRYAIERQRLMNELKNALAEIKVLKGILPICSQCKKIRDDKGYWNILEAYIQKHSNASFTHGICTECSDKLYGDEDWYIDMKKNNEA
ncbi:response regulator [Desulfamplus magnetovallimortis]|nr:response regulator [Desulfamplus magnetovallimortis]